MVEGAWGSAAVRRPFTDVPRCLEALLPEGAGSRGRSVALALTRVEFAATVEPMSLTEQSVGPATPPVTATGAGVPLDPMPMKGDLQIKDRRSWKSWQLITAIVIAALVGMFIGYQWAGPGGDSSTSSTAPAYTVPSSSGSTTTTTAAGGSTTTTAAGGATTTTAAGGTTATTAAGGSTTPSAAAGPSRRVGRSAAAARELDEPHIHHDCGGVEYRMGIQVFSRPGGGRVVPGVRDAGGLGAHGNARDQRDGGLGAIGHSAELARSSDVGRAGSRELYLGRQGHWFVARIAHSAENGSADPSAARQSAVAVVPGSSSLASSSSSSSKKL